MQIKSNQIKLNLSLTTQINSNQSKFNHLGQEKINQHLAICKIIKSNNPRNLNGNITSASFCMSFLAERAPLTLVLLGVGRERYKMQGLMNCYYQTIPNIQTMQSIQTIPSNQSNWNTSKTCARANAKKTINHARPCQILPRSGGVWAPDGASTACAAPSNSSSSWRTVCSPQRCSCHPTLADLVCYSNNGFAQILRWGWIDFITIRMLCPHSCDIRITSGISKIDKWKTYPSPSYTFGSALPKRLPSPSFDRVVVAVSTVVGVKELLEPLQELKVVLELCLHQLVHLNALKDITSDSEEGLSEGSVIFNLGTTAVLKTKTKTKTPG